MDINLPKPLTSDVNGAPLTFCKKSLFPPGMRGREIADKLGITQSWYSTQRWFTYTFLLKKELVDHPQIFINESSIRSKKNGNQYVGVGLLNPYYPFGQYGLVSLIADDTQFNKSELYRHIKQDGQFPLPVLEKMDNIVLWRG